MFIKKNFVPNRFCICSVGQDRLSAALWVACQHFTLQLHCCSNRYHVIYGCFSRPHNSQPPATFSPDAESILIIPPGSTRNTLNPHSAQDGKQSVAKWTMGRWLSSDLYLIRVAREMLLANILRLLQLLQVVKFQRTVEDMVNGYIWNNSLPLITRALLLVQVYTSLLYIAIWICHWLFKLSISKI